MRHVDAVVQDVRRGGGRGVAEDDALRERRVGGGKGGWGGGLVGRRLGEGGRDGCGRHVRRRGHHPLHHLLLLDAWRRGRPPAGPHARVGRV